MKDIDRVMQGLTPPDLGPLPGQLAPGVPFDLAGDGRLWRVRQGLVAAWPLPQDHRSAPRFVALRGDLVGAEALAGAGVALRVVGLAASALEPVDWHDEAARGRLLAQAYAQARRQGQESLLLRTGPLPDRVKQMLLMLGAGPAAGDESEIELPSLRVLAQVLNATPEAVCRVLGQMRQLRVLVECRPGVARVATRALADLVPLPGMSSGKLLQHPPSTRRRRSPSAISGVTA